MMGRVFRTSGTTGEPKRIAISWNAMAAQVTESVAWHRDRRGPWWVTTGMHTPIGYYFGLVAILCRYPAVVELVPSAQSILEIKPRVIGLVPIHTEALLRDLPAATPSWPLSLVSVGAALSPSLAAEVRRRLTSDATSAYGCTETGSAAVTNLDLMEREPMAAGVILHGVNVRIVDDEGAELPAGELGRVCISSDKLAMGFLGEPQLTAEHFRDGWFYTTDLGRLREDGILFVEGRTDELMNLGGHKLLPSAIDTAVATCPGVKEAAAFAFTGRNGLDRCGIAVVAGDGFDEAAVARAAASRMMKVQRSRVMLVDSLPRNMMGKVERLKLREMMEQKVGAARV
jgi:fatty-acyl-CoA synthase/O-succinylbenzoic acid--CoA ligase